MRLAAGTSADAPATTVLMGPFLKFVAHAVFAVLRLTRRPLPTLEHSERLKGGQPNVVCMPGEALTVPSGLVHSARNVASGIAVELATYIVEKDKPLLTVVQ